MEREWYYQKHGRKLGPFTPSQLKALADHEKLRRNDSVWKEGMSEWVPAERISGLFPDVRVAANTSRAAAGSRVPPPESTEQSLSMPVIVTNPGQRINEWPEVSERAATTSDTERRHYAEVTRRDAQRQMLTDLAFPAIAIDILAAATKDFVRIRDVRRSVAYCLNVGHSFLMLAVILGVSTAIFAAVKLESVQACVVHLGIFMTVLFGQWIARNFSLVALDSLEANPSVVRTHQLLDTLGTLGSVLAFCVLAFGASLIVGALVSEEPNMLSILFQMLFVIVLCFLLLVISGLFYSADALNVRVDENATAGAEFLGLVSFVLKVGLYVSPFIYTGSAILGCLRGAVVAYQVAKAESSLGMEPVADALTSLLEIEQTLIFGCLAPLQLYLVFLGLYLMIDLSYAILGLSGASPKNAAN